MQELKSEKEALERAIEEGRTIIESVNIDRKMVEDYKVMNAELEKCGVGPQEPRKFHNLLRVLRMNNYDYAKILNAFADIGEIRRSLLKSLKILAKSKRIGVTELLLDVFREHV